MLTGWRYRLAAIIGVAALASSSVYVANLPIFQDLLTTYVPRVRRLEPIVLDGGRLGWAVFISTAIVLMSFIPLFRPEPRRVLDVMFSVEKRVIFAVCAMATLGYFEWSHRLPRQTVILTTVFLSVSLPALFVVISRVPSAESERIIVVGDDPTGIEHVAEASNGSMVGYVAPPTPYRLADEPGELGLPGVADGGQVLRGDDYIGGLSRFEEAIREYNVDSVILAFEKAERAEFFGVLHTCYQHGVNVKTHIEHTDSVLIDTVGSDGAIADIDLEPWDVQDRLFKRLFDLAFAGTALLVLSPVIILIAIAIKIEGNGPVFFTQERTYRFGDTFTVYKFRTLKPVDDDVDLDIDGDRRTPLGDFLRITHLDEIPQLWPILTGEMSVVGPRPAITELESDYENQLTDWRQRWFVKPGLTGLAQIHDATGKEPERKLRYDIEYIRDQSFVYDVQIVLRQIWKVLKDVRTVLP